MSMTHKVLRSDSAHRLDRYLKTPKYPGDHRVYFSAAQHCTVETCVEDFRAIWERLGTDLRDAKPRATYERVDRTTGLTGDGEPGTHVLRHVGGRWRKMPVRAGETPTHRRVEPEASAAGRTEAIHTIYAVGLDDVNPCDPEAMRGAFEGIVAHRREDYSGLQELYIAHVGGGGFHVHVMSNIAVVEEMTVGDQTWRPGHKMSGALTDVHQIRDRSNKFFERHPEYGITQTVLAQVGTPEYEAAQIRSGQKDHWELRRAAEAEVPVRESGHAKARRLIDETLPHGDGTAAAFMLACAASGVEVKEVGLRRGKPTKKHDYAYRLKDGKAWVAGKSLGQRYTYDAVRADLVLLAQGKPIVRERHRQHMGEPKPLPYLDDPRAVATMQAEVDAYAQAEIDRRAAVAREEAEAVGLEKVFRRAVTDSREHLGANQVRTDRHRLDALEVALRPSALGITLRADDGRLELVFTGTDGDRYALDTADLGDDLGYDAVLGTLRADPVRPSFEEQLAEQREQWPAEDARNIAAFQRRTGIGLRYQATEPPLAAEPPYEPVPAPEPAVPPAPAPTLGDQMAAMRAELDAQRDAAVLPPRRPTEPEAVGGPVVPEPEVEAPTPLTASEPTPRQLAEAEWDARVRALRDAVPHLYGERREKAERSLALAESDTLKLRELADDDRAIEIYRDAGARLERATPEHYRVSRQAPKPAVNPAKRAGAVDYHSGLVEPGQKQQDGILLGE